MSSKNTKLIRDLIIFYVKENYKQYLQEKSLQSIPEEQISGVVDVLYSERKSHLKEFLKKSLKDIMKEDYMGDLAVQAMCNEIFQDDTFCKQRLTLEIKLFQEKNV
jgi:hypothetical protein